LVTCAIFVGFNRSVWHALWVMLPAAGAIYLWAFFSLKIDHFYYFDPKHNTSPPVKDAGDFEAHSQRYQDLAKLAITLSAAVVAFLINTLANEKQPIAPIISRIEWSSPIVVGFFGFSVANLVGFMVAQSVFYEEYCHSSKHDSYVRWKYATSQCLGWTGLLAFVVGFGWLAANLFSV